MLIRENFLAIAIMVSILVFSVIHFGVGIGIINIYRNYKDMFRPQVGLASFNLIISFLGLLTGAMGLFHVFKGNERFGQIVAFISAALALFTIASLIAALVINSKSSSYVTNRFSNHLNQYSTDVGSKDIVNQLQSKYQCCGSNLWIDWASARLSYSPMDTTTTGMTASNETTPVSNITTTTITTATNNASSSTISSVATTLISIANSTTESTMSSSISSNETTTLISIANSTTESTMSSSISSNDTTTLISIANLTTASTMSSSISFNDTTTIAVAPMTSPNNSGFNTSDSTSNATESTTVTNATTVGPTSSSDGAGTSNMNTVLQTNEQTTTNASITQSPNQRNIRANQWKPVNNRYSRDSYNMLDTFRRKRQSGGYYSSVPALPLSVVITLPGSCCQNVLVSVNDTWNYYCFSAVNGTENIFYQGGCARPIDVTAGNQAMGIGVINCFLFVLAILAIPLLIRNPTPYM